MLLFFFNLILSRGSFSVARKQVCKVRNERKPNLNKQTILQNVPHLLHIPSLLVPQYFKNKSFKSMEFTCKKGIKQFMRLFIYLGQIFSGLILGKLDCLQQRKIMCGRRNFYRLGKFGVKEQILNIADMLNVIVEPFYPLKIYSFDCISYVQQT